MHNVISLIRVKLFFYDIIKVSLRFNVKKHIYQQSLLFMPSFDILEKFSHIDISFPIFPSGKQSHGHINFLTFPQEEKPLIAILLNM